MLDAMRQGASGWLAKILLGLLVVAFAVWGVSGRVSNIGADSVASVGSQEVPARDFDIALRQRVEQLSRQAGTAVTMEQANALGVSQQVLNELLSNAALDNEAAKYNLGASSETLAQTIADDPTFQGTDGRFDRDRFRIILSNSGYNEDTYVDTIRRSLTREQLIEAIGGGVRTPQPMVEAYYRYQNEERALSGVRIDASTIEPVGEPTETELQDYYAANTSAFRAPEYRKLDVIVLTADAVADPAAVSDADIAAEYDRRRNDFTRPARRHVEELRFPSPEALSEAETKLAGGTDFETIVAEQGTTPADIDLGLKTRAEFIDPQIAEAAFTAGEGDVVPVPDGMLGPALIRITAVDEGGTAALSEVSARLRNDLASRDATDRISTLYDSIEDERAAGASVAEAARTLDLPLRTIDAVARDGSVPDGSREVDLPGKDQVVADAFLSDIGVENDPIRTGDGSYVFYDVAEVIPARDRTLEEAREDVVAAWRQAETAARIEARANELYERLKNGASMEQIALEIGKEVLRADSANRGGQPPAGFSQNAEAQAFSGPNGHVANAEAETAPDRILVKVENVLVPAFFAESDTTQAIQSELSTALERDLVATFNSQVLQEAKTSVNNAIYAQITGTSQAR